MARPGIMLYFDILEPIKVLPDADKGRLLVAILEYGQCGTVPEFDGMLALAWGFVKPKIDKDSEEYNRTILKRQYATFCRDRKRRGEPDVSFEEWLMTIDDQSYQVISHDTKWYPTTTTTTSTPTNTSTAITTAAAASTNEPEDTAAAAIERNVTVLGGRLANAGDSLWRMRRKTMSRPKIIPDDVKKSCLALVQGYDRRRKLACSSLELQRVQAVEYAIGNVGHDLTEHDRQILLRAILRSCTEGRKYPFEKLGVDMMERTCFYDRRIKFLADIAKYMEMI